MTTRHHSPAFAGGLVLAFLAAAGAAFLAPALARPESPTDERTLEAPPEPAGRKPAEARPLGHLRVRVNDPSSTLEPSRIQFAKTDFPARPDAWPMGARLVVERAPGERAIDAPWVAPGRVESAGVVAFERLEPGRYVVGIQSRDIEWEPRVVDVRVGAWTEVELPCTASPAVGTLVIDVVLPSTARSAPLAISVEDFATGVELVSRPPFRWNEHHPPRLELPAGRWRVVVGGAPTIEDHHGTVMEACGAGRCEQEVLVEPERDTHVVATVPDGARLNLAVRADIGASERAAFVARFGDQGEFNLEHFSTLATLELRRPGRIPLPVEFRWEMTGSSAAGTHLRSAIAVGTRQVSELLPAGSYTLVARLTSGRSFERQIELVAGTTIDLELAIE